METKPKLNILYKQVADLIPYENNPRKNNKAIKAVADSIKEFGFKVPIILDANDQIIAGHTRLLAAKRLKMKEVPCIVASDLTPDQARAFRLVDNKVSEIAEWDIEKLMIELQEIEMDLTTFGFEAEKTINDVVDDDFDVELPEEPKTKEGELWQLGEHRLIIGDSTDPQVVQRLVGNEIMDCLITDPPYNVDYEGTAGKIQNDNMNDEAFKEFLLKAFNAASDVLKAGGAFYIYHADRKTKTFRMAVDECGLLHKQTLIWVKNNFTLGREDYQWQHEPILYGWKAGGAHYFIDDRTLTTIIKVDKPPRNTEHPTMKPIELIGKNMINSTRQGENVLDLFGGSGTTLIVAEQLKRKCFMCELDPKFADVIINRWEQATGGKAVKL